MMRDDFDQNSGYVHHEIPPEYLFSLYVGYCGEDLVSEPLRKLRGRWDSNPLLRVGCVLALTPFTIAQGALSMAATVTLLGVAFKLADRKFKFPWVAGSIGLAIAAVGLHDNYLADQEPLPAAMTGKMNAACWQLGQIVALPPDNHAVVIDLRNFAVDGAGTPAHTALFDVYQKDEDHFWGGTRVVSKTYGRATATGFL